MNDENLHLSLNNSIFIPNNDDLFYFSMLLLYVFNEIIYAIVIKIIRIINILIKSRIQISYLKLYCIHKA